ncbi:MAG TPA: hypothetical protein ENH10_02485 [Bacteroidetes bacterium]|nr:hypothetical protein [Bacteroidota bacterium]HEX04007.1 hypothetical protein [Bacteroidota bacterium]
MNSKNVRRLEKLENITLDTTPIVITAAEWQVLVAEHDGSDYNARQAFGRRIVLVQKQADKEALEACLGVVRRPSME